LPHGLPRSLMMPDEGERDFRSTHAERFLIGYVGDIGEMDGVDIAIEALAILRSHDVDAELLIVGSGTKTYMMRLDTLVRRLEIVDRVHWVTRIENSKLPRLLGQCRVCIAPFRVRAISETAIQNKVLEYLTTDVAVVTSWSPTLQWAFGSAIAYATPGDPSDLARIVTPFLLGDEVSQEQLKFRPVIRRAFHWSAILASEVEIIERVVLRAGEPVRGRHWLAEMNFAPPHADD